MADLTAEERAELRRLRAAGTPGSWTDTKPTNTYEGFSLAVIVAATAKGQNVYTVPPGGRFPAADQRLIPAAVNAIVPLVDQVDALEVRLKQAERERNEWMESNAKAALAFEQAAFERDELRQQLAEERALRVYAISVRNDNAQLADDLEKWLQKMQKR